MVEDFNIFGVPLNELDQEDVNKGQESLKEKNMRREYVKDLIETLQRIDEEADPDGIGLIQNFEKPKRFFSFFPDPSSGNVNKSAADAQALRYEDEQRLRASIILDIYRSQLSEIKPDNLREADKQKYTQVMNLLEYLENVKIIDAKVLLKIINIHRCQL